MKLDIVRTVWSTSECLLWTLKLAAKHLAKDNG